MRSRQIAPLLLLIASVCFAVSARAEMVHRWSFNNAAGAAPSGTTLTDSVSGGVAIVRGTGASFTGSALTLPGTTTGNEAQSTIAAYVDLPNGIISSKTNLTVEVWATPVSSKNWQRLFDFGRTVQAGDGLGADGEWTGATVPGTTAASDNLMLAIERNTAIGTQRMEVMLNTASTQLDSALTTTLGVQYHYVLTYESGVGAYPTGGRITWYRNGAVAGSVDVSYPLSDIEDVNNWLGRSQYTGDSNSNVSYNEFRIYNNALSASEVAADYADGPEMGLIYRWSFNNAAGNAPNGTVLADSISGAPAIVRGTGATLSGTTIVLPGTTTGNQTPATVAAYIDLPNGILSARTNATIEIWARPVSSKNWQRLFDFGNSNTGDGLGAAGEWTGGATTAPGTTTASDEFGLALDIGTNMNQQRLYGRLNYDQAGVLNLYSDSALTTAAGTRYHYVVTYEQGVGIYSGSGGRESWFRDGTLIATVDLPYYLSVINDVNNWLGRSQFSGDSLSNVAFDEFRLYNRALTAADVIASRNAGPDALVTIPAPVANADTATMHAGQKARITVLANDTGSLYAHTVSVATPPTAGTASVDSSGVILYTNTNAAAAGDSFTYTVSGPGGVSAVAQVTITFSNNLRISNPALAMPSAPPATFYQVTDALPGVTFAQPLCVTNAPGETNRLFVCERMAKIQCVTNITGFAPAKQIFLDIQQVVAGRTPAETIEGGGNNEHGLLGLAFHPNYATNGYFYAAYTVRISGGSYYQRISRFHVSGTNANVADPASELILLQQLDEGPNHDGGDLHFGPDGYLYYGAGDEENPNDTRVNSQKLDKDFFSGIFRIDVDKKPGNLAPNPHSAIPTDAGVARFSVPADNPFVPIGLGGTWNGTLNGVAVTGTSIRMEYWALGLRHPWRFSFDSLNGDLWAGDVGQDTYEEIDKITKGGNYGWVYREGAHNTNFTAPVPPTKPAGFTSIDPVYEYPHPSVSGADPTYSGNSVVGGIIYRGSRFSTLYGSLIFCDSVTGHIWKRDQTTGVVTRITGVPGVYGGLVAMGTDPSNQDVLFADYLNGRILRLATGTPGDSFPTTLSATGLFADLTDLSPSPGLLPYDPNLTFWSDYAVKRRWFGIPSANSTMTWAGDANWTFPTDAVWVKHFDLELTRGNPATKRRIETRVLVKTGSSAYGVSYRWNDAQTEATIVPDEGVEFNIDVIVSGTTHTQRWGIPSRSSCLTCHTPQAGSVLSFSTRQLNKTATMNGFTGNQLTLLRSAGYFTNDPGSPNLLPRHLRSDETAYPVEARVRSYLAVNCSYCHRADGSVSGANWDGRPQLTLTQTNLINGVATNNGGNAANRYIVPGDMLHSIVLNRVSVANGFTRMPPLASSELDPNGIALLQEWIANALPLRLTYDQWRVAHFGSSSSPEGVSGADPDGDGRTNYTEFIANTDPLNGSSFLSTQFSKDGTNVNVGFNAQAGRSIFVETTTDLVSWTLWNVPGNNGTHPAGSVTLTGPALGASQFFRLRVEEN